MNEQAYLTFKLNQFRYGIPATAVEEIFFLPEVTVLAAAPSGILGVINRRGDLLPVLDLYQQLGQSRPPVQLSDSIVVLRCETQAFGIIVGQVEEVQTIATEQIATTFYGQADRNLPDGITIGLTTIETNIVTLLNPAAFVHPASIQVISNLDTDTHNDSSKSTCGNVSNSVYEPGLYDHFDCQAWQILRERTTALQRSIASQDASELIPLAVVGLGGEFFGFELEMVYEFTKIHRITPIPCCPPHIVGNINLRGEIITLINISDVIDLPLNVVRSRLQAVIVRLEERVAGIAVDEVFDVTYLHPAQLRSAPLSLNSRNDDYLQGVAPYQDHMMSIINLSKLLISDRLVVNEEV